MDTTPEYKKQCKAAFVDIGFIFSSTLPNLLIVDNDELLVSWAGSVERITDFHRGLFKIHGQLYRQDQLQGLVKYFKNLPPTEYSARGLLEEFWNFVDNNWLEDLWTLSNEQTSMEQLWLAFVMHERFGKTWDSDKEQWVKEG